MNKYIGLSLVFLAVLLLAACGPSPEEIAAMTEAAYTATPVPTATATPTATPLPIDLSLQILDEEGQPIEDASISLDGGNAQLSNSDGGSDWAALPAAGVIFNVSAQGYLSLEIEPELEYGSNSLAVNLERDPFGIRPTEACGPGETLLYLEDFQNLDEATGWDNIDAGQEGWKFAEVEDQPGNWAAANSAPEIHPFMSLAGTTYHDAAWRFFYLTTDVAGLSFNWLHSFEAYETDRGVVEDARYQLVFDNAQENHIEIRHLESPVANYPLTRVRYVPAPLEWHLVEISTLGDVVQVWVDGQRISYYTDPNPLPEASLSIEYFENTPSGTTLYIDNVSICGLSEEFQSITTNLAEE